MSMDAPIPLQREAAPTPVPGAPPTSETLIERLLTLLADETGTSVALEVHPTPGAGDPAPLARSAGSVVSVPGRDGREYGRIHVAAPLGQPGIGGLTEVVVRMIGERLEHHAVERAAWDHRVGELRAVLDRGTFDVLFQPIVDLITGAPVGVEALARFPGNPSVTPDRWFADAAAVGMGAELEIAAIDRALGALDLIPDAVYVSVNVSPSTIVGPHLRRVLRGRPLDRIVFEVTEHAEVTDYPELNSVLKPLRRRGLRLAVDDAGAGFASLRHILRMTPDIIKLDRSLVRGIDRDAVLRALSYSIAAFASATDAAVVAEGVETETELDALRFLGVAYGQGFHLCRPCAAEELPLDELAGVSRSSAG
jgi:EAL domain-containing protein (putative c-di-GMP-specific phosphodiesterase class I)